MRLTYMKKLLQHEIDILIYKIKFLSDINNKKIIVYKKTKENVI